MDYCTDISIGKFLVPYILKELPKADGQKFKEHLKVLAGVFCVILFIFKHHATS